MEIGFLLDAIFWVSLYIYNVLTSFQWGIDKYVKKISILRVILFIIVMVSFLCGLNIINIRNGPYTIPSLPPMTRDVIMTLFIMIYLIFSSSYGIGYSLGRRVRK